MKQFSLGYTIFDKFFSYRKKKKKAKKVKCVISFFFFFKQRFENESYIRLYASD